MGLACRAFWKGVSVFGALFLFRSLARSLARLTSRAGLVRIPVVVVVAAAVAACSFSLSLLFLSGLEKRKRVGKAGKRKCSMSEGQVNFNVRKMSSLCSDVQTSSVIDTDNACQPLLHLSETDIKSRARYRKLSILLARLLAHRCCPVQAISSASIF